MLYKSNWPISQRISRVFELSWNGKMFVQGQWQEYERTRSWTTVFQSHCGSNLFFHLEKQEYCVQGKARSRHKSLTNFIIWSYIEYILERPIKEKCNDKRNEKIKKNDGTLYIKAAIYLNFRGKLYSVIIWDKIWQWVWDMNIAIITSVTGVHCIVTFI